MSAGPDIDIRVEADEVIAEIKRAMKLRGVRAGIAGAGAHVLSVIATYPPKRPSSAYRRTGTLGRRWAMRLDKGGLRATVGNNTDYAPEVQGDKQKYFHRQTGWPTTQDVMIEESGTIEDIIGGYMERGL